MLLSRLLFSNVRVLRVSGLPEPREGWQGAHYCLIMKFSLITVYRITIWYEIVLRS